MTDPHYLNAINRPNKKSMSVDEMQMLMPNKVTPEDDLTRLLKLATPDACKDLAKILPSLNWNINEPWYAARLYDVMMLNASVDDPDLARAMCKVVKAHPGMKGQDAKTPFSEKMIESFIKNQTVQSIAVCFSFWPNHLPGEGALHILARSSSKKFEALRLFVETRTALIQAGQELPSDHAASLMMGAIQSHNMNVLKCVLPITSKTRKDRSLALSAAVNFQNEKAARYLVKTASVCEALMVPKNRLDKQSLESEYDKLADLMQNEDVSATDYLLGDEFDLPAIRARAQQIRLRASSPQAAQKSRPSPRL